ncbi:MAG: glycosyltransferase family 4 protein [Magnetovibrionaceae bacterium]
MARIVLADDGIEFDGRTPEERPLGGVESSICFLVEELAKRGHDVSVYNNCKAALDHKGVAWRPISGGLPEEADLYIANRGDKLILGMPKAKKTVFWTHNPAQYVRKWRYVRKLFVGRPPIIFIGSYAETTLPWYVPHGGKVVIPYGIPDIFRGYPKHETPPPPKVVFTSNPLRSLDWILDIWSEFVHPAVPDAELHIFSGAQTYGHVGDAKADPMARVLAQAEAMKDQGVILRGPKPKAELIEEMRSARAMLYRSDLNETFCLALGEAQALGVPCVVQPLGSGPERVRHGETGFVEPTREAFAQSAIRVLTDDTLWATQHAACIDTQGLWGWEQAAAQFEAFLKD